jgi:glycosyltransferase involved in cell wall biosynthesis
MRVLCALKLASNANVIAETESILMTKMVTELLVLTDSQYTIELPKVTYYYLPNIIVKMPIIRIIARLIYMIYICFTKKPDMLICYHLTAYGVSGIFCSKIFGMPVSVHLLGEDIDKHIKSTFWGPMLLHILKKSNAITTQGRNSKSFLADRKITKNVHIVPTIGNLSKFYPVSVPKEYDVIFVGRLGKEKRIDILLKAILKVKKTYKKEIKAAIVGSGPLLYNLKEMTSDLDLRDNVEFLGWQENVEYYVNKSKLFILTSEREQLPLAMIEAMACGVVPIVPDVGNITDVANHSNSIVVKPLDVDSFSNAVIKLLNEEDLYKILSQNALDVRKTHSVVNNIKIWGDVFESIGLRSKN